jgi:pimeloyl-ACP methyl ester carboxylesterase
MSRIKQRKYISSLHMNGMDGRILRKPSNTGKKRQILLLYGHHASLERMYGLAEVLGRYGYVTMPDLPGFGGMDSFYKIGEKPTLDNYADYLASIIKLYYKRRRLTIVAMSFSVPLVVRMLQRYPEIAAKVDIFISIAGFVRKDDFVFSRKMYWGLRTLASVFATRPAAALFKHVILTRPVIRLSYMLAGNRHSKLKDAIDDAERDRRIDFEVGLWKSNDVRTRMKTMTMMFTIDVCDKQVHLPAVYHVTATEDRYFDNEIVMQHLKVIFNKVELVPTSMPNHAPSIVASAKDAAPYVPMRIRRILG